ncbi:hypothetical protein KRIGEM_03468 [Komagataeibacter rhaeticus]|nr:hypothetical protein KRIGEM_03468 [Komagataeibacter rhaeticus]
MIILSFSAAVTPIKGLPGDEDQQFVAFNAYVETGGKQSFGHNLRSPQKYDA